MKVHEVPSNSPNLMVRGSVEMVRGSKHQKSVHIPRNIEKRIVKINKMGFNLFRCYKAMI